MHSDNKFPNLLQKYKFHAQEMEFSEQGKELFHQFSPFRSIDFFSNDMFIWSMDSKTSFEEKKWIFSQMELFHFHLIIWLIFKHDGTSGCFFEKIILKQEMELFLYFKTILHIRLQILINNLCICTWPDNLGLYSPPKFKSTQFVHNLKM